MKLPIFAAICLCALLTSAGTAGAQARKATSTVTRGSGLGGAQANGLGSGYLLRQVLREANEKASGPTMPGRALALQMFDARHIDFLNGFLDTWYIVGRTGYLSLLPGQDGDGATLRLRQKDDAPWLPTRKGLFGKVALGMLTPLVLDDRSPLFAPGISLALGLGV